MESMFNGIEPPEQAPTPAVNGRFVCPHCGAPLSSADSTQCPRCGIQFTDDGRKEQIERLLKTPLSQTTYTAAASISPASAPLSMPAAEPADNPSPAPAAHAAPPYDNTNPSAGIPPKKTKHRRWLIAVLTVLLLAILCFSAVAAVNNTRLGYNASPEKLIMGFQKALNDNDKKLMTSLFLEEQKDMVNNFSFTTTPPQLEVWDVIQGEKAQLAFIVVIPKTDDSYDVHSNGWQEWQSTSPLDSAQQFYAIKSDGKWYLDFRNISWRYSNQNTDNYSY